MIDLSLVQLFSIETTCGYHFDRFNNGGVIFNWELLMISTFANILINITIFNLYFSFASIFVIHVLCYFIKCLRDVKFLSDCFSKHLPL